MLVSGLSLKDLHLYLNRSNASLSGPLVGLGFLRKNEHRLGIESRLDGSCSSNVSLSGPLVGLGFLTKKLHAEHGGREQLGWKFGIGKEKVQLKFGKVKNKKNKKLLCMLTWIQKGYFEQLFEK